jgi:F-type H+-transporting ATPase subunit b
MPFSVALGVILSEGSVIDLDGTVFVQLVIFFIVFFLLRSLVFRPVLALFDAREQAIEGEKENAREMENKADEKHDKYESEMRRLRDIANQERDKLRAEGQKLARDIADKARAESNQLLSDSKTKLEAESDRIRGEVKVIIPGLARQIASKLLDREVR